MIRNVSSYDGSNVNFSKAAHRNEKKDLHEFSSEKNKMNNSFGEAAILDLSNEYYAQNTDFISADILKESKVQRTLKYGSKGSDVKILQSNLVSIGYNPRGVDGLYGPGTKKAVIKFQKIYGLTADGIVGSKTMEAINKALRYKRAGGLSRGQISHQVKILQRNLMNLGYYSGGLDGIFGVSTEKAVRNFQRIKGLTNDGIAGSATQRKINQLLKNSSDHSSGGSSSAKSAGEGTVRNVPLIPNYDRASINETNANYVWDELIKAGFTKEAAAGVMGNLTIENSFNTTWSGDQGSVGIAQWRGTRKSQLERFAVSRGMDKTSIQAQTKFLIESDLPSRIGNDDFNKLKTMTDYIDATDYFCDKVESPSSYKTKSGWLSGKYGPNYKSNGGPYLIGWERYEWSDILQKYELDLKERRSAANYWYKRK